MSKTTTANQLAATSGSEVVASICQEILRRHRFLLTSHARPDGDSIGSQLAMAYALEALGKDGHNLFANPDGGDRWQPLVAAFLTANGR